MTHMGIRPNVWLPLKKFYERIKNPEERWTVQKAKLKLAFTHLNDDDFTYDNRMRDVMLEQLQQKLGKSRED